MPTFSVLDPLVLGYSPVFSATRSLCGLRLSVWPLGPAAGRVDGEALWAAVCRLLPPAATRPGEAPALWLSPASEALLDAVLAAAARDPQPLLIEIPGFLAGDRAPLLQTLSQRGQPLGLAAGDGAGPPTDPALGWRCGQVLDDPLAPVASGAGRSTPLLLSGARTDDDLQRGFARGAVAVAGWSMDDECRVVSPSRVPPEIQGVLELMNRVQREESVERLEAVLNADPSLAYRLLRHLNSSALGLRAEIGSFRHGLMMLGHRGLQRWLALMLATGGSDPQSRMLMAVAARRGLILDALGSGLDDDTLRGELFICGVFSLLDRMFQWPLDDLLERVPMPQRVQASLLGQGPYSPHLALLRAIEGGTAADIQGGAEAALVGLGELNRALVKGLGNAWGLA